MAEEKGTAGEDRGRAIGAASSPAHRLRWTDLLVHRWPTAFGAALAVFALVDDGADGSTVTAGLAVATLVMAAAYLPIGAFRGHLDSPRLLAMEVAGVIVFGGLALAALLADGRPAQYLLAAAWLGHAAWDVAHHRADKVVPGWYAEACAIFDVGIAVGILLAVPHV